MSKKAKADLKYRIEINWSAEDEAYIVRVPELPGCITHGDTPEQALKMAHVAVEGYLETLKRRGLPVPKPLAERKFTGKIPLRIDPVLHRDLASKATIEGVSLNKLIETKLKKAV
ncbi:MAG: type II toxin-antitoxin system HicB family antitoxin [Bdellovibrionota bacterium]